MQSFTDSAKQLEKSSKERESVLDEATRRITSSPALKQRMGSIQASNFWALFLRLAGLLLSISARERKALPHVLV